MLYFQVKHSKQRKTFRNIFIGSWKWTFHTGMEPD